MKYVGKGKASARRPGVFFFFPPSSVVEFLALCILFPFPGPARVREGEVRDPACLFFFFPFLFFFLSSLFS